jgi:hypothetical protein
LATTRSLTQKFADLDEAQGWISKRLTRAVLEGGASASSG